MPADDPTATPPATRFSIAYRLYELITHDVPWPPAKMLEHLRAMPRPEDAGSRWERDAVIVSTEAKVRNEVPPADELATCNRIAAENASVAEELQRLIADETDDYMRLFKLRDWAYCVVQGRPDTVADFVNWAKLKTPTERVWEDAFHDQGKGARVPMKEAADLACELIDAADHVDIYADGVVRPSGDITYHEARAIADQLVNVARKVAATEAFHAAYERAKALAERQAWEESKAEATRTLAWPLDFGRIQWRAKELFRRHAEAVMTPAQLRELDELEARGRTISVSPDDHRMFADLRRFAPLAADELAAMDRACAEGTCGPAIPSVRHTAIADTPAVILPRVAAHDERFPPGSDALRDRRSGELAELARRADAAMATLDAPHRPDVQNNPACEAAMTVIHGVELDVMRLTRLCVADGVLDLWPTEQAMVDAIGRRIDGTQQPPERLTLHGWRIVYAFVLLPALRRAMPASLPDGPLQALCVTDGAGNPLNAVGGLLTWTWRDGGSPILSGDADVKIPEGAEAWREQWVNRGRIVGSACLALGLAIRNRIAPSIAAAESALDRIDTGGTTGNALTRVSLNKLQQAILALLEHHDCRMTVDGLRRKLPVPRPAESTMKAAVRVLIEADLAIRPSGRSGGVEITQAGRDRLTDPRPID